MGMKMSDIPHMYDPSKLLVGNGVMYEMTAQLEGSKYKTSAGMGLRLMGLRSDGSEDLYHIEYFFSDGFNGVLEVDRFPISNGLILDTRQERHLASNYHTPGLEFFAKKTVAFLSFGVAGVVMNELFSFDRARESYAKCLMELSNRPKNPKKEGNKITAWRKIGIEDLMIQGKKIACEVYEIQGIKKFQNFEPITTQPWRRRCIPIPGEFIICEWYNKLWISGDVPFGIAKAETRWIEQVVDSIRQSKTHRKVQVTHRKFQVKQIQRN
jgi:hypothetical protein